MKKYIKLFSDCIAIHGESECAIIDIGRGQIIPIPHYIYDLIVNDFVSPIDQFLQQYKEDSRDSVKSFIKHLVEREVAFYTDIPHRYPALELNHHESPFLINNAVIEYSKNSSFELTNLLQKLVEIDCRYIQLRILDFYDSEFIESICKIVEGSTVRGIELFIRYSDEIDTEKVKKLIERHKRLVYITYFDHKEDLRYKINEYDSINRLRFTSKNIAQGQKDVVKKDDYYVNLKFLTESIKYNASLYKKLSVTEKGEIKNYLNHEKSFGNVDQDDLIEIVLSEGFREQWYITNDNIKHCKGCVNRYSCNNCSEIQFVNDTYIRKDYCHLLSA